jgi:L-ascorbate metabolism protein UlaG (beta-lactamase superfamily)
MFVALIVEEAIANFETDQWWEDVSIKLDGLESKAENANAGSTGRPDAITAQISCLPCQHVSARSPFDKNHTLWASWSVESGGKKVWFAGDTGYRSVPALAKEVDDYGEGHVYPRCPAFAQIGKLRGPFDLGMIPIGAYDPRWVMSPMHANPFDSVEIFKDTQCRRALAMHWGTWVLTEEDVLEPPVLLKKALAKSSLPEVGVFDICEIGESIEIS